MSFISDLINNISSQSSSSTSSNPGEEHKSVISRIKHRLNLENDTSIEEFESFYKLAKQYLAEAIDFEEYGNYDSAKTHYQKSINAGVHAIEIANRLHDPKISQMKEQLLKWKIETEVRLEEVTSNPSKKKTTKKSHSMQSPPHSPHKEAIPQSHSMPSVPASSPKATSAKSNLGSTTWHPTKPCGPKLHTAVRAERKNQHLSSSSSSAPTLSKPDQSQSKSNKVKDDDPKVEQIKGVDSKLIEVIENEIVDRSPGVKWDDIAGLFQAKSALKEMVILPTLRSDLFKGLREPERGLLLFGPPGNGKTMLAKAVASEADATFFSVSASSLTSKWVGEGEKLMRALFAVAAAKQPAVIFIDEIDSILSSRSANEHEASRRLKTEFLVQFDGVQSTDTDRVIVMGATNRPQELDDAARRRLVKRIYIPLPDADSRKSLFQHLLQNQPSNVSSRDLDKIVKLTEGYSGSDLRALCKDAAMMPLRELGGRIQTIQADQVRKLELKDFQQALSSIRPSVSLEQLKSFEAWNKEFGSS